MCGIAGIFDPVNKPELSALKKLSDTIRHRGPDGEGFWIHESEGIGFAHRRLSIIDLSDAGSQPMHRGDLTIVYNGEIYNYLELKRELESEGIAFGTSTDTEVLLALYEKYGIRALHKLDGMFAFAIWDNQENELILARDRFGEKPLFYSFINGAFCFASEMKSLFACGASRAFSPDRVYKYLQNNVFIDEEDAGSTFYRDILQLDAASFMRIRGARVEEITKYWSIDNLPVRNDLSIEDAAAEFRRLLADSLKIRLRSDVPMGACLSGGIDSSSLVYLLGESGGLNRIGNTFSARFSKFAKDEGFFIGKVLSEFPGIRPHFTWPDKDKLGHDIETLAYAQEEPFYSGSVYNQFSVMRLAHEKGITVLLEGQGADEQLGGYNHHYQHHLTWLFLNNLKKYLSERKGYDSILGQLYPYHLPRRLPLWYLGKILKKSKFVYDEPVRGLLLRETTRTGLKSLLRYGDRNSMAFGREVRLPFLCHHLSEFIFSLPVDFILHGGWTKFVLRKAVEDIVPPEIAWRREKIGFEPPQSQWLESLAPATNKFKSSVNYLDFTGGRKVDEIGDWKWLMLKLFFSN